MLHNYQPTSSPELHNALTTELHQSPYGWGMSAPRIHKGKQPNRPHFIEEWAKLRGFKKQADLAAELDTDKSVVSRWYNGTSPAEDYQERLAALFHIPRDHLFRHPDEVTNDDWIARFFRRLEPDELDRAKQMLEAAFPVKARKAG